MTTKERARRRRASGRSRGLPLFPIVVGVVVVVLLGVIVASALGDDGGSGGDGRVEQTRPVTVTGDPLPRFTQQSIADDPAVGLFAPTVSGQDFVGDGVEIAVDGRPQAIAFVAHWCPHCRAEVPRLAAWLSDHDLPDDVELVIVPTATSSTQANYPPSEWLSGAGVASVPTLVDSDDAEAYGAFGAGPFPYWVLLDAEHRVMARFSGEFANPEVYTSIFGALASGEPLPDPRNG